MISLTFWCKKSKLEVCYTLSKMDNVLHLCWSTSSTCDKKLFVKRTINASDFLRSPRLMYWNLKSTTSWPTRDKHFMILYKMTIKFRRSKLPVKARQGFWLSEVAHYTCQLLCTCFPCSERQCVKNGRIRQKAGFESSINCYYPLWCWSVSSDAMLG